MRRIIGALLVGASVAGVSGCAILGPSCLAQQKRGDVTTISGSVEPGQIAAHVVRYGVEGSQNDARWTGQGQLKVYATRTACVDFRPGAATGVCATIGGGGGTLSPNPRPCVINRTCNPEDSDIIQNSLTVTNQGPNADLVEYKIWVAADPAATQPANYTIAITWFRGPDC
jgi:hypothetical protein